MNRTVPILLALTVAVLAPAAMAQSYASGSTAALGDFLSNGNVTLDVPADGILHYKHFTVQPGHTVRFKRNARNTAIYLLASGHVTIKGTLDVSGSTPQTIAGIGYTVRGGKAGPGGGDGGSCDTIGGVRYGGGYGPGGGAPHNTLGAGGGASPIGAGSQGYNKGGAGGASWSHWSYQNIVGGSGGGCGKGHGGSGGGGALIVAASGTITLTGAIYARGGAASSYGGAGGGGMVRLVATQITGSGQINVMGTAGTTNCSKSNYPGGCGAAGLLKVEGWKVSGSFMANTVPVSSLFFGTPQPAVPGGASQPTLKVSKITGETGGDQLPPAPDLTEHTLHPTPKIYLEAGKTITVEVTATHVPVGTTVKVRLNTLGYGAPVVNSTALAGTLDESTATATFTIPAGTRLTTVDAWIPDVPAPVALP